MLNSEINNNYYCYVLWCLRWPLFTIISMYENNFPDRKKMIRILRTFISFVLLWQKCAYQRPAGWEKRQTGRTISFFSSFIEIRERHREIKRHRNNKVIIHFDKLKFTINKFHTSKDLVFPLPLRFLYTDQIRFRPTFSAFIALPILT